MDSCNSKTDIPAKWLPTVTMAMSYARLVPTNVSIDILS